MFGPNIQDESLLSLAISPLPTMSPSSSPSCTRLRILNRGDVIGAFNCLFPSLQLQVDTTAASADRTMPVLDSAFSLFSGMFQRQNVIRASSHCSFVCTETPQELQDIFSSARKYRAEVAGDFASRKQRLLRLIGDQMRTETTALAEQQAEELHQLKWAGHAAPTPTQANTTNPLLDKEYVLFASELAAVESSISADFRHVETLIGHLFRTSDERLKTKQIAPFNSNLPVLNISECSVQTPVRPKPTKIAASTAKVVATPKKAQSTTALKRSANAKNSNKRNRATHSSNSFASASEALPVKTDAEDDRSTCDLVQRIIRDLNEILESSDDCVDENAFRTVDTIKSMPCSQQQIVDNNVQMFRQQVVENERRLRDLSRQQRDRTAESWQKQLEGITAVNSQLFKCGGQVDHANNTLVKVPSMDELELQAVQQYCISDESLETQFSRLECEAQNQYLN